MTTSKTYKKASEKNKALTPAEKAALTRQRKKEETERLAKLDQQRLAQMVNLHIGGFTLEQIATGLGMTADEVSDSINRDTAKYVKSQPALRIYVRNWVSSRYTQLLDAIWEDAVDPNPDQKLSAAGFDKKLASQDRAIKILSEMSKLHGANAPVQTEVKVEAAPEAVEQLVAALSAKEGLDYDLDVFDVVDAELVHESVIESAAALEMSSNAVSGNQIEEDTDGVDSGATDDSEL